MPWPGHAQLIYSEDAKQNQAIKGFLVCNGLDLGPFDLLNGIINRPLRYRSSPEL